MVVFMDEDVPNGASTFMLQRVLDQQLDRGHLDVMPARFGSTFSR